MSMMEDVMERMFDMKHNENGKGIEVERVGSESEMNKILKHLGIKG